MTNVWDYAVFRHLSQDTFMTERIIPKASKPK